jgi:hypothetical protein
MIFCLCWNLRLLTKLKYLEGFWFLLERIFLKIIFLHGEIFEFSYFFFCLKILLNVNGKAKVSHTFCILGRVRRPVYVHLSTQLLSNPPGGLICLLCPNRDWSFCFVKVHPMHFRLQKMVHKLRSYGPQS